MPDRIVGRALTTAQEGERVLIELADTDDDLDYEVTAVGEPQQGWSVAWVFVVLAFVIGLAIGAWAF